MRIEGTFTTKDFKAAAVAPVPAIATGLPVGVSTMEKVFGGRIAGHAATVFVAAFDPARGAGSYIAMESFEGELDGRRGAFAFVHSAATTGADRSDEFFSIVAGSGTGSLAGIRGGGGMAVDPDGTHRIWFDIEGIA